MCLGESEHLDAEKVQIATSIIELNQEEVTAVAHHEPQVCAVDTHCHTTSHKFVQWGDQVHLDSKTDFGRRDVCGRRIAPYCKEFTRPRSIEGCRFVIAIPGRSQIVLVPDVSVSEIKVSCAWTFVFRQRHRQSMLHVYA